MPKPSKSTPSTLDLAIGLKISTLRKQRDWTQAKLAQKMTDIEGEPWTWTDQVVIKLEKGQRPIRLAEAKSLAGIFEMQVQDLLTPTLSDVIEDVRERATSAERLATEKSREASRLKTHGQRLETLERAAAGSTYDGWVLRDEKNAFEMLRRLSWSNTVSILLELGASREEVETLSVMFRETRTGHVDTTPVLEGTWALIQRLVPALGSASE